MYLVFHVCHFLDHWKKVVSQIKEICLRSVGMLPRKFKKWKILWNSTFCIPLKILPIKKINFEKVNMPRTIRITETFFNFYSIALATKNVDHTLTPCSLCSYSLDCPEPKTAKVESCSKKPERVFPKSFHTTLNKGRDERRWQCLAKRNKIFLKNKECPPRREGERVQSSTSDKHEVT